MHIERSGRGWIKYEYLGIAIWNLREKSEKECMAENGAMLCPNRLIVKIFRYLISFDVNVRYKIKKTKFRNNWSRETLIVTAKWRTHLLLNITNISVFKSCLLLILPWTVRPFLHFTLYCCITFSFDRFKSGQILNISFMANITNSWRWIIINTVFYAM